MFTVVIDESGDTGLDGVAPDPSYGPTQYFCMCATIFREKNRSRIEDKLSGLKFGSGAPHANKLSHFEKIHFCRTIVEMPVAMFGVVSNKLTLLDYLSDAKKTPTHYYNKVMQYLLERVGAGLAAYKIPKADVRILLEARAQQYSSLLAFVDSIQRDPIDLRSLAIRNIDRFSITSAKKADDRCMSISDMGANALFSAVRRDNRTFGLSETRYLNELAPVFVAEKGGRLFPNAVKAIHNLGDLGLPKDTAERLATLENRNKRFQILG